MAQFIEFIANHPVLASMWVITLGAIVVYHRRTASDSVGPQEVVMLINRKDALVVDVRDKKDFDGGHIVDSVNIPFARLKQRIPELKKHKEKPVVVVCKLGHQSGEAAKALQEAGWSQVVRLTGGVSEWKARSFPLVQK